MPDAVARMPAPTRSAATDAMRLVLALVVVLGHGRLFSDVNLHLYAGFVNGIARTVVPFFLLLSGFYFHVQLTRGFGGWLRRIVLLYLVWSLLFLPYEIALGDFSMAKMLFYALTGYAHLWYLPALIGGGVVLWMVRGWRAGSILALAIGLIAVGYALQCWENATFDFGTLTHANARYAPTRNFLFFGFPYLALGHVMQQTRFFDRWTTGRLALGLGVGLAMLAAEAALHFHLLGMTGFFDIFASALIVTPFLFALVQRIPMRRDLKIAAPLSAAIYFLHPAILVPLQAVWTGPQSALAVLVAGLSTALALAALLALRRYRRADSKRAAMTAALSDGASR